MSACVCVWGGGGGVVRESVCMHMCLCAYVNTDDTIMQPSYWYMSHYSSVYTHQSALS